MSNELNARQIHDFAGSDAQIEIYDKLPSTNVEAMKDVWKIPGIVVAKKQTAGKGQHGNDFASPKGNGIYVTFIVPMQARFVKNPALLTLGVGVAVCSTISEVLDLSTKLKWVNDIYFQNKKVGGILTEVQNDDDNHSLNAVIGIGLNVTKSPKGVENAGNLGQPNSNSYNELIGRMFHNVSVILGKGDQTILDQYNAKLLWKDEKVSVENEQHQVVGVEVGVDANGRLIIETDAGYETLDAQFTQHIRYLN